MGESAGGHPYLLIPSGEHTKSNGKIHHAINGKIHYFYGHKLDEQFRDTKLVVEKIIRFTSCASLKFTTFPGAIRRHEPQEPQLNWLL